MAILTCNLIDIGAVGVDPKEWAIKTNDTYETVTTTGYLTGYQSKYNFSSTDYAQVYTTDVGTIQLSINISEDVVSFVNNNSTGMVTLPVTSGDFVVFDGTTGNMKDIGYVPTDPTKTKVAMLSNNTANAGYITVQDSLGSISSNSSGGTAINPGPISSGASGIAGSVNIYPSTASKGRLSFSCANNTGDTVTTITTQGFGQITTLTIPDPGPTGLGSFVLNTGGTVMGGGSRVILAKLNGTESANAVTTNTSMCGVITTSSLTTAAGGSYVITWTDSFLTPTSVLNIQVQGGTNTRRNFNISVVPGNGTATLTIYNNEPTNALNGTIVLGYVIW